MRKLQSLGVVTLMFCVSWSGFAMEEGEGGNHTPAQPTNVTVMEGHRITSPAPSATIREDQTGLPSGGESPGTVERLREDSGNTPGERSTSTTTLPSGQENTGVLPSREAPSGERNASEGRSSVSSVQKVLRAPQALLRKPQEYWDSLSPEAKQMLATTGKVAGGAAAAGATIKLFNIKIGNVMFLIFSNEGCTFNNNG